MGRGGTKDKKKKRKKQTIRLRQLDERLELNLHAGEILKFSDTLWGPSPFHINVINFDCYCVGPLSEGVALALNTDI